MAQGSISPPWTPNTKTIVEDIDALLRSTWGAITKGNLGQQASGSVASRFLREFGVHFVKQPRRKVANINAASILAGISQMPDNCPGPDSALAADLKVIIKEAAACLARLFNFIEEGGKWPSQLLFGRPGASPIIGSS